MVVLMMLVPSAGAIVATGSYGGFVACNFLSFKVGLGEGAVPASSFLENWKLEVAAFNVSLKRMAAFLSE